MIMMKKVSILDLSDLDALFSSFPSLNLMIDRTISDWRVGLLWRWIG